MIDLLFVEAGIPRFTFAETDNDFTTDSRPRAVERLTEQEV
jgi:hypothetical protein